ncbi:MAG: trypsin-like peptidase domain-containing protein [Pseudomonadota bacterium]|nr:trypsin-like peptidase domain-containing protein [Pseudomonadota bacterium]
MNAFARLLTLALFALFTALPTSAAADPADIEAAARGVVRVVLISDDGEEVIPISHGSGFAVTSNRIVTNAHVIREALQDDTLRIGIVPSEAAGSSAEGAFARAVAVSPRNDLALLEIADGALRLPPLTIAGGVSGDMGGVSAVGYPMNVDLAQGLEIKDIFSAQPPVKSQGFLSGERPSRQFDTLLHTAPIARGNSGGPLLDSCGRVLGVNSFGADSDGSDAEFYFAVSLRELLPFLRANDIEPRTNALPCRSIEELNAAERARFDAQREEARQLIAAREASRREAREAARMQALLEISEERDNAVAIALILLLCGLAAGYTAVKLRQGRKDGENIDARAMIAAGLAGACLIALLLVWITRPGFAELEDRVAMIMGENEQSDDQNAAEPTLASEGTLICTLVEERSRITGARTDDVEFDWGADGCVNGRTQYGMVNGDWTRVFVPNDEDAVSINTYDPNTRIFQSDRYLLGRSEMSEARESRSAYTPPSCGVTDGARVLGEQQSAILSILPDRPNERLVYTCEAAQTVQTAAAGSD